MVHFIMITVCGITPDETVIEFGLTVVMLVGPFGKFCQPGLVEMDIGYEGDF